MKKKPTSHCHLEGLKTPLTVGDIFTLHCTWAVKPIPPLKWEWDNKTPYQLVMLKTIVLESDKGVFEITSYQPGMHLLNKFKLHHKKGVLDFAPLEWTVQSVIPKNTKKQIKPYPPYGPWQKAFPFWGMYTLAGIGLGLIIIIVWRLVVFFKRRKWVKQVSLRTTKHHPFRYFISNMMLLERTLNALSAGDFVNKLQHTFLLFLEEVFFVQAGGNTINKTLKHLRQDHPVIYKQYKNDIMYFLKELSSPADIKASDFEQLLNMGRELGIKLFSAQQKNI